MSSRTGQVRRNWQGAPRRVRRATHADLAGCDSAVEATFNRICEIGMTLLLVRRRHEAT